MILDWHYTEKEKEKLLKSIGILVDTREQKNEHIIQWFDKNKIKHKSKALKHGDYSFYIPKDESLNIYRDIYMDKSIMIERKRNLDEIAGNFTTGRTRFEEEFSLYKGKKYILIENNSYDDIFMDKTRSKMTTKAFLAAIHTFNNRYNVEINFMPRSEFSAIYIYSTFYYYLREKIR